MPLRIIPALHRANHRIGLSLERLERPSVNPGEAHVLAHLAANGDCTIGDLHRSLAYRRSTLTGILDRLARAGYILRGFPAEDKRTVLVRITAQGKRAAEVVYHRFASMERLALRAVPPSAVRDLLALLAALERAAGIELDEPTPRPR